MQPVDLLASYGTEALASREPDFEDALIAVSAEHEDASAIISRDKNAFAHCDVPKLTAAEFLEQEGFSYDEIDL